MRTVPAGVLVTMAFGPGAVMSTPAGAHDEYPVFEGAPLREGRAVWLDNCLGCHGDGTADAPRADTYAQWEGRLEQPREELYRHAIEGFFGPDYAMMPPRGGNPALSDAEVRAAVDYMVRLVGFYRSETAGRETVNLQQ